MNTSISIIVMCGALFSACGLIKVAEYELEEAIEEDLNHHKRAPHHYHRQNLGSERKEQPEGCDGSV